MIKAKLEKFMHFGFYKSDQNVVAAKTHKPSKKPRKEQEKNTS